MRISIEAETYNTGVFVPVNHWDTAAPVKPSVDYEIVLIDDIRGDAVHIEATESEFTTLRSIIDEALTPYQNKKGRVCSRCGLYLGTDRFIHGPGSEDWLCDQCRQKITPGGETDHGKDRLEQYRA